MRTGLLLLKVLLAVGASFHELPSGVVVRCVCGCAGFFLPYTLLVAGFGYALAGTLEARLYLMLLLPGKNPRTALPF